MLTIATSADLTHNGDMRKRLVLLVVALAAVVGLSACGTWGPGYCYGEGRTVTCVSPGNPGSGG